MKLYVGLPLPREIAELFPEDAERGPAHITLLFSEVDADVDAVRAAIDPVLASVGPIDVELSGVIDVLDGGERPAAVVQVSADAALRILRLQLRGALTDAGIETPQTHDGYRPHATHHYLEEGEEPPTEGPAGRFTCRLVDVRCDDQGDQLQLGVPARDQLAALRFGADLQAEADRRLGALEVPEGWVVGRPFRCAATGQIYDRWTGKQRGRPITREGLDDAIAILEGGEDVGIDESHDVKTPGGTVLAAWVVDDGDRQSLAVLPAYGPRMARYVAERNGFLWSSPEFVWTDVADARTGEKVGSLKLHSLALTHDPAQAKRVLDRVQLTNDTPPRGDDPDNPPEDAVDEIREMLGEIMKRLEAVEAEMAANKQGAQMAEKPPEESEQMGSDKVKAMGDEPDKEQYSSAESAEIVRLQAELAKVTAKQLQAERAGVVQELLTAGKIAPAEKAAAEAVYDKGGRELLQTVYGERPEGHVVPKTKGHGQKGPEAGDNKWAQLHQQAQKLVAENKDDPDYDYGVAVRVLLSQQAVTAD